MLIRKDNSNNSVEPGIVVTLFQGRKEYAIQGKVRQLLSTKRFLGNESSRSEIGTNWNQFEFEYYLAQSFSCFKGVL